MIAWSHVNAGAALWGAGKHEDAILAYRQAIALFERSEDPLHLAAAQMNLGNVYIALKQFEEALRQYEFALPVFREMSDTRRLAAVYNNMGMAYRNMQQGREAEHAFLLSIGQWQKSADVAALINTMDNLGESYLERGLREEAVSTLRDALEALKGIKDDPAHDRLYEMVSAHLREAMGDDERPATGD
jgi:tetratricopeptide (TPR) repeat protein